MALAPGLQTGVLSLASENWRGGIQWDWHQDVLNDSGSFGEFDGWIRHDLNADWGGTIHFLADSYAHGFKIELNWYH